MASSLLQRLVRLSVNVLWLLRPGGLRQCLESLNAQGGPDGLEALVYQLVEQTRYVRMQTDRMRECIEHMHQYSRSTTTALGQRMMLDPTDGVVSPWLSRDGIWEPLETDLILQEVSKGDTVLDIGANIGYHTLLFARLVGPKGRVYAFEPDPDNIKLLRRNVFANGHENVVIVPGAVTSRTEPTTLYLDAQNKGDHRIYDSHDGRCPIQVEGISLDEYFGKQPPPIQFVKMDIQGAEAGAISGMYRLLERNPNLKLLTEFWPRGLHLCGTDSGKFLEDLLALGFDISLIGGGSRRIDRDDIPGLLKDLPVESGQEECFVNLFCTKRANAAMVA